MTDGATWSREAGEIGMTDHVLRELVAPDVLAEVAGTLHRMTGVPVRVLDAGGQELAAAGPEAPLCSAVRATPGGLAACESTRAAVTAVEAPVPGGVLAHPCFTGARYAVISIDDAGYALGRVVLGPFRPAALEAPPPSLFAADATLDEGAVREGFAAMPVVHEAWLSACVAHARSVFSAMVVSGRRALLTSQMHLAAMGASYRELREHKAQLEIALGRMQELDRLKSSFLATMSHELRTPLTAILGYGELLAEGLVGALTEEQLECVNTIREKGEQLLRLLVGLLDFSRLESGSFSMQRRPVPIAPLLDDVASTLLVAAQRKGVSLEVRAPATLPELSGDPDRLRQVFLNLAENAVKFTPQGGRVVLSAREIALPPPDDEEGGGLVLLAPAARGLEVRVEDTGIGIPEAHRRKIFDPFYQVDATTTREHGGTGLGLSIVERLLAAHEGSITVEETVPRGTTFVVTLPLAVDPP